MSSINARMSPIVLLALVTLSVIWGGAFFFAAIAVDVLPPMVVVWLRVAVAAVTLWIIALAMRLPLPSLKKTAGFFLFMGFFNNIVPFGLIFWGQTEAESGLASIFNATTPMFTILVASVLLTDERLSLLKALGILAGVIGVALMVGFEALFAQGGSVLAQLAFVLAAVSYSFAIVSSRGFFVGLVSSPIIMAMGQSTASTLLILPYILIFEAPLSLPMPGLGVWTAIILMGVVSTALAYILYFFIIAKAGATNASLVTFLIPASAILLGALFLGERLEFMHFLGLGVILLGLALVDGRLFQRSNSR